MNFYEYPQCQEYSCIHTPYNDSTFYETLESSGALSLGTTAGTNRSISTEFGDSAPHAMSEFYADNYGISCVCVMVRTPSGGNRYTCDNAASCFSDESSLYVYNYINSNECIFICFFTCANQTNSGISSGNPLKFSDFYGDSSGQACLNIGTCVYAYSLGNSGSNRLYCNHNFTNYWNVPSQLNCTTLAVTGNQSGSHCFGVNMAYTWRYICACFAYTGFIASTVVAQCKFTMRISPTS